MTTANILSGSFDSVFSDCYECDRSLPNTDLDEIADGDLVCPDCLAREYRRCDWTQEWYYSSDLTETRQVPIMFMSEATRARYHLDSPWHSHTLMVCDSALERDFTRCDDCEEYAHDNTVTENRRGRDICQHCLDEDYFTCRNCGDVVHNDYRCSGGYCEDCSEPENDDDDRSDYIYSYSTNPLDHLSFHGNPPDGIFFGVELETNSPSYELQDNAETCSDLLQDFAILKEDSSIGTGFEIVSAPATLGIHRDRWGEFLEKRPSDMTSWNGYNCGMHVHISRQPLSQLTVGKILVLINEDQNFKFIRAIAGRNSAQYAAISDKKISDCKYSNNRFEAVNLENDSTIEIRIFKGTLDKLHFMANLEFCHAVTYYCQQCSMRHLSYKDLMAWVRRQPKSLYCNLIKFLESKGY